MVVLGIILFCYSASGLFCVIDSMLYTIDPADFTLHRRALPSTVIDISADADAYVLTDRYLYKVVYPDLSVRDRILLPQRFNHIITDEHDIILIGTNEVILVDKTNLAFKAGIGMESGDYVPIAVHGPPRRNSSMNQYLYLHSSAGQRSTLKIFDLDTGALVKKMNRDRILSAHFDAEHNTISTLGANNIITEYDMDLHVLRRLEIPPEPLFFMLHESGYAVYCREGIFLMNRAGRIIDFQAIPLTENAIGQTSMHLVQNGIAALDMFTMRPKAFKRTDRTFTLVHDLNDAVGRFGLVLDEDAAPFLFDAEAVVIQKIPEISVIAQTLPSIPGTVHQDSLWYFQLGAFTIYDNALEAYTAMKNNNLPVFIDSSDMYRIRLGGFRDKEIAMKALELTDLTGWFILQERTDQSGTATFSLGEELFMLKDGIIERRVP